MKLHGWKCIEMGTSRRILEPPGSDATHDGDGPESVRNDAADLRYYSAKSCPMISSICLARKGFSIIASGPNPRLLSHRTLNQPGKYHDFDLIRCRGYLQEAAGGPTIDFRQVQIQEDPIRNVQQCHALRFIPIRGQHHFITAVGGDDVGKMDIDSSAGSVHYASSSGRQSFGRLVAGSHGPPTQKPVGAEN